MVRPHARGRGNSSRQQRTRRLRFFSSRDSSSSPTTIPSRPRFLRYTSSGAWSLASLTAVGMTSSMVIAGALALTAMSSTTGFGVKLKLDNASRRPHSSLNKPPISSCDSGKVKQQHQHSIYMACATLHWGIPRTRKTCFASGSEDWLVCRRYSFS